MMLISQLCSIIKTGYAHFVKEIASVQDAWEMIW